jgi:hypothetical protein
MPQCVHLWPASLGVGQARKVDSVQQASVHERSLDDPGIAHTLLVLKPLLRKLKGSRASVMVVISYGRFCPLQTARHTADPPLVRGVSQQRSDLFVSGHAGQHLPAAVQGVPEPREQPCPGPAAEHRRRFRLRR